MSVTINFSKNTSAPWQSNANMLKSTREKIQRQEERDGKIAFFETQKQNLKNQKADTIEEIAKKLEKFHTYEDEIAAAKQEYNSSQMFHILDEAEERGEQMAKAAEKYKPKTEEEQKKEAQGEAAGTDGKTDDKGVLSEIMDDMSESIEHIDIDRPRNVAFRIFSHGTDIQPLHTCILNQRSKLLHRHCLEIPFRLLARKERRQKKTYSHKH